MKKIWFSIAMLVCSTFAGNILNADGSINKESAEYIEANEKCINGCDYDDWKIVQKLQFSSTGDSGSWKDSFGRNDFSESKPLFIGFSATVTTDQWKEKNEKSIPAILKITAEHGFKYYMISRGNGDFAWIQNEREGIYKFHVGGHKNGKRNFTVLKLSSIKSGSVTVQVIYLNKTLNTRYGNKYSIYVHPKK